MITWTEAKRTLNKERHDGIDLADLESVFDSPMVTVEDSREAYGEERLHQHETRNYFKALGF